MSVHRALQATFSKAYPWAAGSPHRGGERWAPPAGAGTTLAHLYDSPLIPSAPPQALGFKGKLPLAGTGFLLPAPTPYMIKTERKGLQWDKNGYSVPDSWDSLKSEVSRNSGFKNRQELPLQISTWPNDYRALRHLSASLSLTERWQG